MRGPACACSITCSPATGRARRCATPCSPPAERGVTVSVLIDDFGSSDNPDNFFAPLRAGGRDRSAASTRPGAAAICCATTRRCCWPTARPRQPSAHRRLQHRGRLFQRADEGGWRDIGLLVDGPAAARLAPYYDALMGWALKKRAASASCARIIQQLQRDQRRAAVAVRRADAAHVARGRCRPPATWRRAATSR